MLLLPVASLYLLCLAFLFGSALYVYSRDPFDRLNSSYAVLALTLLGWVGTLFVFNAQTAGPALLWWGRANFAAAALVTPAAWRFARTLARQPIRNTGWIWAEAWLFAALSLLTCLVDRSEGLRLGEHVTSYGVLFPLYLAHIVAFVVAALLVTFGPASSLPRQVRIQLRLVGIGILVTAVVSLIADALLPYVLGNFGFLHVGTLSTLGFLMAVSYAASVHHLFHVRVLLKKALVFAILIAFALELYQLAVGFLTDLLPLGDPTQRHIAAATVALVINAFSHEPLRWWLERLADRLLSGRQPRRHAGRP